MTDAMPPWSASIYHPQARRPDLTDDLGISPLSNRPVRPPLLQAAAMHLRRAEPMGEELQSSCSLLVSMHALPTPYTHIICLCIPKKCN